MDAGSSTGSKPPDPNIQENKESASVDSRFRAQSASAPCFLSMIR